MPCHAGAFSGLAGGVAGANDDTGFQQVLERADYLAKELPKLTAPVSATLAAVVAEPDDELSDFSVMTCSWPPH